MLKLLLLILLVNPALANPPFMPKNFPNCTKQIDATGDVVCAYTLEKLKKVYKADVDLTELKKIKPLLERKIKSLSSVIDKQRLQFELIYQSSELLAKRNESLTRELVKTDRELQAEKVKPKWGSYIAWGTVVFLVATLTTYIAIDYSKDRKK